MKKKKISQITSGNSEKETLNKSGLSNTNQQVEKRNTDCFYAKYIPYNYNDREL